MLLFQSEDKQCQKQRQSESKYSTNVRNVKHINLSADDKTS